MEEIIAIMANHGVEPWHENLTNIERQLERARLSGSRKRLVEALANLMDLYGGMGSFNDVFVSPEAGHDISPSEVSQVNANLQSLQEELYQAVNSEIDRIKNE